MYDEIGYRPSGFRVDKYKSFGKTVNEIKEFFANAEKYVEYYLKKEIDDVTIENRKELIKIENLEKKLEEIRIAKEYAEG